MSDFCGIRGGILSDCQSRKDAIGGNKITFWLGSVNDIDTATTLANLDGTGNINSIDFTAYAGLYKFRGIKFGNAATDDISQDEDLNPFFPHTVTLKLYDSTPEEVLRIESLAYVDLFVILESSTGLFQVYGLPNGLTITSAPKSTGNQPGDSVARLLTLEGAQNYMRRYFSTGDAATTRTALESYEV